MVLYTKDKRKAKSKCFAIALRDAQYAQVTYGSIQNMRNTHTRLCTILLA